MNIYHIRWVQSDSFELNAVAIAESEAEALNELNLDGSYNTEIRVFLIGVCTDGTSVAQIVSCESV